MGNMAHCRFENTFKDLCDCYANMEEDLSESEAKYRAKLIDLCKKIVYEFEELEG